MKKIFNYYMPIIISGLLIFSVSCTDKLDAPFEDETFTSDVDYTVGSDMILPLLGAYREMANNTSWETGLTLGIRGDDVNAAGDQVPMQEQDNYKYLADHWNLNSVWQLQYKTIINTITAMDEIEKYRPAANNSVADQYIAECKTIISYEYLVLARAFGKIIVIDQLDNIQNTPASSKDEVMQYIVDQMNDVIPLLPDMNPNKRSDIRGGITKYTAYAIQALAYQEMENYQGAADATSAIINSGEYQLYPDFYHLFKKAGKLNSENILEFQFSDFNAGEGPSFNHLFAPYGINWTPVVTGAGGGWNFYEPTMKYIKFMLDRGETVRLETSVVFTPDGITQLQNEYGTLPAWISNKNREGDVFKAGNARLNFGSGKYIQPSTELIPGRTSPGSNKNMIVMRYAEMLLVYAEALSRGATSNISMSAADAVNLVRTRAGLSTLGSVTTEDVLNEKFAELATEWDIRFYDMVRTQNTSELSYEGRTFTMDKAYFPIPAAQISELPQLADEIQ